jgi:hypothetical protein
MEQRGYCLLILLLGLFEFAVKAQANPNGFSFEIQGPSPSATASGPVPLMLIVHYEGTNSVKITPLAEPFLDVEVHGPTSWQRREATKDPIDLNGRLPVTELRPGDSVSCKIFLHDFFKRLEPGSATVQVKLTLWLVEGTSQSGIVVKDEVRVNLTKEDFGVLASRINSIAVETNPNKRLEIYRSLRGIETARLVPVFIDALLDDDVLVFHASARRRIVELLAADGNWAPLIRYLKRSGGRADEYFFAYWKKAGVQLPHAEVSALDNSSSPWIRIFALRHGHRELKDLSGLLESLETEIKELGSDISNVRTSVK